MHHFISIRFKHSPSVGIDQFFSYTPPNITKLTSSGNLGAYSTAGGETVTLTGTNFGPQETEVRAIYATVATTKGLSALAASTFRVNCTVVSAHTQIECELIPGVGFDQAWKVSVGGQNSSFSTQTTSYQYPSISSVMVLSSGGTMNTRGGDTVQIHGLNFGPIDPRNVITVDYQNVGLSGLAASLFHAVSCSVASAHKVINCTTVPGVGHNQSWNTTVGGQLSPWSTATTSYTAPSLQRFYNATVGIQRVGNSTLKGLDTKGQEFVEIQGDNFGPVLDSNIISASYQNSLLGGYAGFKFNSSSCLVVDSHVMIRCVTTAGVGLNQSWLLDVGDQPSSGNLTTSYAPPHLHSVAVVSASSLSTTGSQLVNVSGRFFGPKHRKNYVNATYQNPTLSHLEGSLFFANCSVVSQTNMMCFSAPGIGHDQHWYVQVGSQWSSQKSAFTMTSYEPPSITDLSGLGGLVFDTRGNETLTLTGTNFGPKSVSNKLSGFYYSTDSDVVGLGKQLFQPNCTLKTAHTKIICTLLPGVGSSFVWYLDIGNQTSSVSNQTTRFHTPRITNISTKAMNPGFSTDGTGKVIIHGDYFGPLSTINIITATYKDYSHSVRTGLIGKYYNVSCEVTSSHTVLICSTLPGVGTNFSWVVNVGNQYSNKSTELTTYKKPKISEVSLGTIETLATIGGETVTLSGDNFGPMSFNSSHISVVYSLFKRTSNSRLLYSVFEATDCIVTKSHVEMECLSSEGVGANLSWAVSVASLWSPTSANVTSYTRPALSHVYSFDPSVETKASSLVFPTVGGVVLYVNGTNFGPKVENNIVSIFLTNENLDNNLLYDGFLSPFGSSLTLLRCSVRVAHVTIRCTMPDGAGHSHVWKASVGGQTSYGLQGFTSSFHHPSLTSITLLASNRTLNTLDTLGGSHLEFNGSNFGPLNESNVVYAISSSPSCSRCSKHHLSWTTFSSHYNFLARNCSVTSAHTSVRCVVPPGVGKNHSWQLVVGLQDSRPLNNTEYRTSYHRPVINTIHPLFGPINSVSPYYITLTGRYFGSLSSGVGVAQFQFPDDSTLNVTRGTFHSDSEFVFEAPVLPSWTDSNVSFNVGGVTSSAQLDFRYFEITDVIPLSAPLPQRSDCQTFENLTLNGYGFPLVPTVAKLRLGVINASCVVLDSQTVSCPMDQGYPGADENSETIVRTPQLNLNNMSWTRSTTSFTFWRLPRLDELLIPTGPLGGGTNATLSGEDFLGSGVLFGIFGGQHVECSISSDRLAYCSSPPYNSTNESSVWGATVDIKLTLDQQLLKTTCLASNNITFYYHPPSFTTDGPYPSILPHGTESTSQMFLLDASPFYDVGHFARNFFLSTGTGNGYISVDMGRELLKSTAEVHREITLVESTANKYTIFKVIFDTWTPITSQTMDSGCQDVFFWSSDFVTDLFYWIEPFTCNTSKTIFYVKADAETEEHIREHGALIFLSYGSGEQNSLMDGNDVFSMADGYATFSDGSAHDSTGWLHPVSQEVTPGHRFKLSDDDIPLYRGNWSFLVMSRTSHTFSPDLVVSTGWDDPQNNSTLVVYASPFSSALYFMTSEAYDNAQPSSIYATYSLETDTISLYGVEPGGNFFSNTSTCSISNTSHVARVKSDLFLSTNVTGSKFSLSVLLQDSSSWITCPDVSVSVGSVDTSYDSDFWNFEQTTSTDATFHSWDDLYVFTGLDQQDYELWSSSQTWFFVDSARQSVEYMDTEVSSNASTMRLSYLSETRNTAVSYSDIASCFNHRCQDTSQFTSNLTTSHTYILPSTLLFEPPIIHLTSDLNAANSSHAERFSLTASSGNVSISSPEITAAMVAYWSAHGSEIGWFDLPLNWQNFGTTRADIGIARRDVDIKLRIGSFETSCYEPESYSTNLTCSLSAATTLELSSLSSESSLVSLSFNDGQTFSDVESEFTLVIISVDFNSSLASSFMGGAEIAALLSVQTVGSRQVGRIQNISFDLGGTGGGSSDPGLKMSVPLLRKTSNLRINDYLSVSSYSFEDDPLSLTSQLTLHLNGTIPRYDGIPAESSSAVVRAPTLLPTSIPTTFSPATTFPPTPSPTTSSPTSTLAPTQISAQPTHTPTSAPTTTPTHIPTPFPTISPTTVHTHCAYSVECPPDSTLNCTACPFINPFGSFYPCFRKNSLTGRCLPPRDTAQRFTSNHDLSVFLRFSINFTSGSAIEWVLDPNEVVTFYDPATVVEEFTPKTASAVRRASDAATPVTTFGVFDSTMSPILELDLDDGSITHETIGDAAYFQQELLDSNGYEEDGPSLFHDDTRMQSLYVADDFIEQGMSQNDTITSLYFKVSGDPNVNLYDFRLSYLLTNSTYLTPRDVDLASQSLFGNTSGNGIPAPVLDSFLSLAFGPSFISAGDIQQLAGMSDSEGQWFQVELDSPIVWDGRGILFDISYRCKPWGEHTSLNFLYRSTYLAPRTVYLRGGPTSTIESGNFVPFLSVESSFVTLDFDVEKQFPSSVSDSYAVFSADITLNGQRDSFLRTEIDAWEQGAFFEINITTSSGLTSSSLYGNVTLQSELKEVLGSYLSMVLPEMYNSTEAIKFTQFRDTDSHYDPFFDRRLTSETVLVVEFKVVSTASTMITDFDFVELYDVLWSVSGAGTLSSDLASAFPQYTVVDSSFIPNNFKILNSTTGILYTDPFYIYDTSDIDVEDVEPAYTSTDGGVVMTISGSGFFTPSGNDGKVNIRWKVINTNSWLTSTGVVVDSSTIVTTSPPMPTSYVEEDGYIRVYLTLSFNGFKFTSVAYTVDVIYYKPPQLNFVYLTLGTDGEPYPTSTTNFYLPRVPGDVYTVVDYTPQSGTYYSDSLDTTVQVFLFINASDVYLSSSQTVCIFKEESTDDDTSLEGCVDDETCSTNRVTLIRSGNYFTDLSGGAHFYSNVEFACEVPVLSTGNVRVSFSENSFSSDEYASDPSTGDQVIDSRGCDTGYVASTASVACKECSAGTYAVGGTECNDCPFHTYQEKSGQIFCTSCDTTTETNMTGSTDITACKCKEGYYSPTQTSGVACSTCPDNAICTGATSLPYPIQGYYRRSFDSYVVMLECTPPTACVGGPDGDCFRGYTSNRCAECTYDHFRLSHYCAECPDPSIAHWMLPLQMCEFALGILIITLGFHVVTKYATLSIFLRFVQLLYLLVFYELSWQGSFRSYYYATNGVFDSVDKNVNPIPFFPLFKTINLYAPLFLFPLFTTTTAPGCPNARSWNWADLIDNTLTVNYFTVDSLAWLIPGFVLAMEFLTHSSSVRFLRVAQRFVALATSCLPAIGVFFIQDVACGLGKVTAGSCVAATVESQLVIFLLLGVALSFGLGFIVSVKTKAHTMDSPFAFLTANKRTGFLTWEFFTQMRTVFLVICTVISENGIFQAGLAICILIFSLVCHNHFKPYRTERANDFESVTLASLIVILFVGMIGAIGAVTSPIVADILLYAGYTVVAVTMIHGLIVVSSEIMESHRESAKSGRYTRVMLGLQQPTQAEIRNERRLVGLIAYVRELIQAMLQGEFHEGHHLRSLEACPFSDDHIGQLLNNGQRYRAISQMRRAMFRNFVNNETRLWFRRLTTHPDVTLALKSAFEKKAQKSGTARTQQAQLRTILHRLIDKSSKMLTDNIVSGSVRLKANEKVTNYTWLRIRKLWERRLENYPIIIRTVLKCNDDESFSSHYVQSWRASIGEFCEEELDSWFSFQGKQKDIKGSMLDCLFDPDQKIINVETMQRIRLLLVSEPSTHHSSVHGVVKHNSDKIVNMIRRQIGNGMISPDEPHGCLGGSIIEVRVALSNCYRDRTDPTLGHNGWSVRLLRERESRAFQSQDVSVHMTPRPVDVPRDGYFASLDRASSVHAKIFNFRSEGWHSAPGEVITTPPFLQIDLGRICRVAALSLQGGSINSWGEIQEPSRQLPREAFFIMESATQGTEPELDNEWSAHILTACGNLRSAVDLVRRSEYLDAQGLFENIVSDIQTNEEFCQQPALLEILIFAKLGVALMHHFWGRFSQAEEMYNEVLEDRQNLAIVENLPTTIQLRVSRLQAVALQQKADAAWQSYQVHTGLATLRMIRTKDEAEVHTKKLSHALSRLFNNSLEYEMTKEEKKVQAFTQRLSMVLNQFTQSQLAVEKCLDLYREAVSANPFSYGAQTGLAVAQEELRHLRSMTAQVKNAEGAGLATADTTIVDDVASGKENEIAIDHVLAAGPREETLEISPAFMTPGWVNKYTALFSRDGMDWHAETEVIDGVQDPEMIRRVYLPSDTRGQENDPFEARYVRFKPVYEPSREWHHHISMRVQVEEVHVGEDDEQVIHASSQGWDPEHPEPFHVEYKRSGVCVRFADDPIGFDRFPVVQGVVSGRAFPRLQDQLMTINDVSAEGLSADEAMRRIVQSERPLRLKFLPRDLRYARIEEECYELLYPASHLGISIQQDQRSHLPVVIQPPEHPTHANDLENTKHLPEVDDQIVGIRGPGQQDFTRILESEDPYMMLVDLISTVGRPVSLRFYPNARKRESNKRKAIRAMTMSQLVANHPEDRRFPRYEVTFETERLGIGLECQDEQGLPMVTRVPLGMNRPRLHDLLESIEGNDLRQSSADSLTFADQLLSTMGRPVTLTFVELPHSYELEYTTKKLGITLADRGNDLPTVEANLTGKQLPYVDDRLVAVGGESLISAPDPYQFAIDLIRDSPRPLFLTFETHQDTSSAAKVPQNVVEDEGHFVDEEGSSSGEEEMKHEDPKPATGRSFLDMFSAFGLGSGAPPTLLSDEDVLIHGGAPTQLTNDNLRAEDTADADAEVIVAIFDTPVLGVDLVGGASDGHVPILGTQKEVTVLGNDGSRTTQILEPGSQLIQVANVRLIDVEDPFLLAIQTIQDSPRPVELRFQHPRQPAPYCVVFHEQSLGLGLDTDEDTPSSLPLIVDVNEHPLPYPQHGDRLLSVQGTPLTSSDDKLSEAVRLIRTYPRPLRLLFQPNDVDSDFKRTNSVASGDFDQTGGAPIRTYGLEFSRQTLGIMLGDSGPLSWPKVDGRGVNYSSPSAVFAGDGVAKFVLAPGIGELPLPMTGDSLVKVNNEWVIGPEETDEHPHDRAVELLSSSDRPVIVYFNPAHEYTLNFHQDRLNIEIEEDPELHHAVVSRPGSVISPVYPAPGDIIMQVGDSKVQNYDETIAAIQGSSRPVRIVFAAPDERSNSSAVPSTNDSPRVSRAPSTSLFPSLTQVMRRTGSHKALKLSPVRELLVSEGLGLYGDAFDRADINTLDDLNALNRFDLGELIDDEGDLAALMSALGKDDDVNPLLPIQYHDDGSYRIVFESLALGFILHEAHNASQPPIVDLDLERVPAAQKALPQAGDRMIAVGGEPTEGISNAYDKAIALVQSAPRPIAITFRPPYPGEDDLMEPLSAQDDDVPTNVSNPEESMIDEDRYTVTFFTSDLGINLIENVDPRREPVISKTFEGAQIMKRGDVLLSINNNSLGGDAESAMSSPSTYRPYDFALQLLASLSGPVTFELGKPPTPPTIREIPGQPSLYDCVFYDQVIGIDLQAFGDQQRTVRVVSTHPLDIPRLGDQVVGVNGKSLLDHYDASKSDDVLEFVQKEVANKKRPLTLRLQRGGVKGSSGEELTEARRGFSVLFISKTLGLSFSLTAGVPTVRGVRPIFTAPKVGDVLTAINGAELSKCALTVSQLVLTLKALPRPLRLSFVEGSPTMKRAMEIGSRASDGPLTFPKHYLRQVVISDEKKLGLSLMTISHRPVIQEVKNRFLLKQGVSVRDVIVSVNGKHLGECTAQEAADMLNKARRPVRLGILHMSHLDKESSYASQHPVDIASALTSYEPATGVGTLSFSLPKGIPPDKYRVEVYRYGAQIAPAINEHPHHQSDHHIRVFRPQVNH